MSGSFQKTPNSWNLRHTFSSPPCSLEKKEDRIHEVYKIFIWHFASGEHCGGQWCVSDFTVTVTHRESCAQINCVVMYCVNTVMHINLLWLILNRFTEMRCLIVCKVSLRCLYPAVSAEVMTVFTAQRRPVQFCLSCWASTGPARITCRKTLHRHTDMYSFILGYLLHRFHRCDGQMHVFPFYIHLYNRQLTITY